MKWPFILFYSFTLAGAEPACVEEKKSFLTPIEDVVRAIATQTSYARECIDVEFIDPLLDPYRKQSFALSICQKSETCIQFLRDELRRVSGLDKQTNKSLPATALWSEILMQSGRTRRSPPQLKDLPLDQDPEVLFAELKEQIQRDTKFHQNERVKIACAALFAIVGPGKLKAYNAVKTATTIRKIERTHDVEKLISKNRLPSHVKERFQKWIQEVEKKGLDEVKKTPGYHDEPLASNHGWHSVRLNDGFRACYQIIARNGAQIIEVFSITNDHKNYCRK